MTIEHFLIKRFKKNIVQRDNQLRKYHRMHILSRIESISKGDLGLATKLSSHMQLENQYINMKGKFLCLRYTQMGDDASQILSCLCR